MKQKILFMHQASTVGGGSFCLLNLLKVLDITKWEPIVCLVNDGSLRNEVEKLGIEVVFFEDMRAIPYNHSLLRKSSIQTYFKIYQSLPIFKKILIDYKIDVVYLNNMMLYRYLKTAKECGCKTIMHVREHWPLNEHTIQLGWARNYAKKYLDLMIAINNYSASIFPDNTSTIVHDWIDFSERFEEVNLDNVFKEDTKKLKIFLYTGGTQKIKGAYEVVKTFTKTVRDKDSRLLFMGYEMSKPLMGRKAIIKKILYFIGYDVNELKIRSAIEKDKRIVCIPATYRIVDIIKKSHCMLSYFTIPHANLTLAECIILGTPVIAAKTEESIEYTCGGKAVDLFEINSLKSFTACLSTFNYEDAKSRIKSIQAEVSRLFDPQININKFNEAIISVLN